MPRRLGSLIASVSVVAGSLSLLAIVSPERATAQLTDELVLQRLEAIDEKLVELRDSVENVDTGIKEVRAELGEVRLLAGTVEAKETMLMAILAVVAALLSWTLKEVYAQKGRRMSPEDLEEIRKVVQLAPESAQEGRRLAPEDLEEIRKVVKNVVSDNQQADAAGRGGSA